MVNKYLICFLVGIAMPLMSYAQRTAKVEGVAEISVRDDDHITFFDAKRLCIEQAKNNAIKDEFGELVASDHIEDIVDINGSSVDSYTMNRVEAKARGEWLGDTRDPELEISYIDGTLYFKAHVWGEAREIVSNKVMLKWMIQHDDGIAGRQATTSLKHREFFYVNFLSPIDGYVAIYLTEENGKVSCLLPYRRSNIRSYEVKGGQEYTFFDKDFDTDPLVGRVSLNTQKPRERYTVWLVFSPNRFTKCADKDVDSKHPNEVNNKEFREWQLESRRHDPDMQIEPRTITVVNPNAEQ